ncbi:hypothetical protein [Methanocella arvoryzae]|uniref:Uncharacterized protein n=1 Tax=Methanocella arvoryzae (strain DSM 22066 / NBRC 105507 / MRE50) TaxID=351160 RepID=Q0W5R4_METAR|nr:hypothetical protein [Methanocella arvoryzae]CAJ36279.1 hypothetical protein RCIX934 [Methanocella arvoryzae MRE50]
MKTSVIVPAVLVICIVIVSAAYIIGQKKAESGPVVVKSNSISGNETPANVYSIPHDSNIVLPNHENNGDTGTVNYQLQYGKNKFITDAKVSIYTSNNNSDLTLLDISGNPLYTVNADKSNYGPVYQFNNVPYGNYVIVSEKNGKTYKSSGLMQPATDGGVLGTMVDDPDLQVPASANITGGAVYGWVRHMFYYDYMPGVKVTLLKRGSTEETIYTLADGACSTLSEPAPYSGFYIFEDLKPGTYLLQTENNGKVQNSTPFKITGNEDQGTLRTITSL